MVDLSGTPVIEPLTETVSPTHPAPPEVDLSLLWRQARGGETDAFEALYRRLSGNVYGLALRLTGRVPEAEELTQEVFVRAWRYRERIESADHLRAWLKRVAVNEFLTGRRRSQREVDGGEDGEILEDPDGRGGDPLGRRTGLRMDLERAVARLPERLRAVLVLFDLYGHRHAEIASLLEITETTSKIQLHRARKRLREALR